MSKMEDVELSSVVVHKQKKEQRVPPEEILDWDCLVRILDLLPRKDLVRCERVNKTWKKACLAAWHCGMYVNLRILDFVQPSVARKPEKIDDIVKSLLTRADTDLHNVTLSIIKDNNYHERLQTILKLKLAEVKYPLMLDRTMSHLSGMLLRLNWLHLDNVHSPFEGHLAKILEQSETIAGLEIGNTHQFTGSCLAKIRSLNFRTLRVWHCKTFKLASLRGFCAPEQLETLLICSTVSDEDTGVLSDFCQVTSLSLMLSDRNGGNLLTDAVIRDIGQKCYRLEVVELELAADVSDDAYERILDSTRLRELALLEMPGRRNVWQTRKRPLQLLESITLHRYEGTVLVDEALRMLALSPKLTRMDINLCKWEQTRVRELLDEFSLTVRREGFARTLELLINLENETQRFRFGESETAMDELDNCMYSCALLVMGVVGVLSLYLLFTTSL